MNITVCTPTYNRAHLLNKLYTSLKKQNYNSFQWIIVDDGSTDDTEAIVNEFIKENNINIRYIKKKNGGKHTALNIGIDNAEGELFWIVDSDDYIIDDALKYIWNKWCELKDNKDFAGLSALRGYENKKVIGTTVNEEYIDADVLTYRYKYRVLGDKSEVYRTDILKKYKFPEYREEKFLTEAVVWNRIANDGYKIRWFNKVIYICEYLEGGLTNTSDKNIMDSWQGTTLYYKELLSYKQVPLKDKILNGARAYLHYCYEKGIGFKGIFNITKNPLYIGLSWFVYVAKLSKRVIKRG
mgnify:FL=1